MPNKIELAEKPHESEVAQKPAFILASAGIRGTTSLVTQGAFIRFYETWKPTIKTKFGSDTTKMGWRLEFWSCDQNAFSHGGKIFFETPQASSATWKGITYSPANNGRQIMYQDIAHV